MVYPLVICYSLLLKMTIEIVDLPITKTKTCQQIISGNITKNYVDSFFKFNHQKLGKQKTSMA